MTYEIVTTSRFDRAFKKLDRQTQKIIKSWILKNLVGTSNPRRIGKALSANKSDQWRYRIGDYRLLCAIEDEKLVILFLDVGHRSKIYK